jgi:SNF2 family DNA or RNA helicase
MHRSLLTMMEVSKSKKKRGKEGTKNFVDEFLGVGSSTLPPPAALPQQQSGSAFVTDFSLPSSSNPSARSDLRTDGDRNSEDRDGSEGRERDISVREVLPTLSVPDFSLPPSVYTYSPPQPPVQPQVQQPFNPPLPQHYNPPMQQQQEKIDRGVVVTADADTDLPPTKRILLMDLFTKSGVAKVDSILTHVEVFLSNPLSGKLLIFAHHKKVLDRLSDFLSRRGSDYMRIDGSTASKSRHERMLRFQTVPSCRVAVLAITAAG